MSILPGSPPPAALQQVRDVQRIVSVSGRRRRSAIIPYVELHPRRMVHRRGGMSRLVRSLERLAVRGRRGDQDRSAGAVCIRVRQGAAAGVVLESGERTPGRRRGLQRRRAVRFAGGLLEAEPAGPLRAGAEPSLAGFVLAARRPEDLPNSWRTTTSSSPADYRGRVPRACSSGGDACRRPDRVRLGLGAHADPAMARGRVQQPVRARECPSDLRASYDWHAGGHRNTGSWCCGLLERRGLEVPAGTSRWNR